MASSTRDQEPKAKALKGKGIRCTNQQGDEQGGTRPPHVYLVFDDWPSGYSIREVIPPRYGSSHHCHTAAASEPDTVCVEPPPPVVVRLEAVRESPCHFPVAFGTKILAVHTRDPDGRISSHPGDSMLMLMFDVCERSLTFCAGQDFLVYPIYFSVGDKLFCLSYGFFQMLIWEPGSMARESSWKELPDPPFRRYDVTSYAVHPKLLTFIVSTKEGATEATFAFDTEKLSWKHLGGWALPFAGRGHFDQDLGLFIGLSKEAGSSLGQLCSCYPDTPYMTTLAKENLFSEDPAERHEGATLVHIGPNKFCLVQCVCRELDLSERRQFLYRLTTLSLEHRHTGGLTIREKQPVQYYQAVAELRGGHPGPPPPLHHEKNSK